jgi:RimJ/RimL family protein N-acetyltransferase
MRLMGGGELQIAWPSSFPELITKRLRLRAPLPRDASAVLAVVGDPEVTRYHSVPTFTTLVEAQAALERLEQRYAARDAIRWAFLEEGTRRDYLYSKGRFHSFRWFALLESDESDHPATI